MIHRLTVAPWQWAALRRLRRHAHVPFRADPASPLVVSLTSFPARIGFAWRAIESIFLQDTKPSRVVLVLSHEEFPDRAVPRSIEAQVERGLEILWATACTRSYQKLLPALAAYPEASIVTVDDDVIYHPWVLTRLLEASRRMPDSVIGCRGRVISGPARHLAPYGSWPMAGLESPWERIVLTGVGAILYPPRSLPPDVIHDVELARSLCPTADDLWFWGCTRLGHARPLCLGVSSYRSCEDAERTNALCRDNLWGGMNDVQFQRLCDHFGLWDALDSPGL